MKSLVYAEWGDEHLQQRMLTVDGSDVSYWINQRRSKFPVILFVHGITGDHNGMIPLARELYSSHDVILLELPGHGSSDQRPLKNAHDFQDWFEHTFQTLEDEVGSIDLIVAHSFGCSAVLQNTKAKIILLCPVPTPSRLYRQYAEIIMQLAPFWALFYSWKMFVMMRGRALRKVRTREARLRVRWVGFQSRASYNQIVYQARLVTIILDRTGYKHISPKLKLIVCGLDDTTSQERDSAELETVFPKAKIEFLRGGHLLPIESPERTAQQVKQIL